jgi:hypothetical protein
MTTTNKKQAENENIVSIAKPSAGDILERFKSKRGGTAAAVEEMLQPLPHYNIAGAKDFVRLHPNEDEYWSSELCFVSVPIIGQKRDTLHLIDEDLAMTYLETAQIKRCRLALASKPNNVFFLCEVPSQNLDNSWNETALNGCEQAKTEWVIAASRKGENAEGYKVKTARDADAFDDPKWPTKTLSELILTAFDRRIIDSKDHPGMLRLLGAKQSVS